MISQPTMGRRRINQLKSQRSQFGLRVKPNILSTISIYGLAPDQVKITLLKRLGIFVEGGNSICVYISRPVALQRLVRFTSLLPVNSQKRLGQSR